ncbi:unnamed protein product, partial [Ixodes persulcatus]
HRHRRRYHQHRSQALPVGCSQRKAKKLAGTKATPGEQRGPGHPRDLPSAEDEGERRQQQPRLALGSEPLEEPASVVKTATKQRRSRRNQGLKTEEGLQPGGEMALIEANVGRGGRRDRVASQDLATEGQRSGRDEDK